MKHKLLLWLAAAAFSLTGLAQENNTKYFKAGIIAGGTYSRLIVDLPVLEWNYAPNFMVGVTGEHRITDNLSAFINLNYERRTSKTDAPFSVTDGDNGTVYYMDNKITQTLNYISIPVSARYYFGTQKRFCANLGLYADILLSDKAKSDHGTDGSPVTTSSNGFKTFTMGINPGMGYSIPIKNDNDLLIDLRYNIGITNAVKNSAGSGTKVNSLILALNYRFGI